MAYGVYSLFFSVFLRHSKCRLLVQNQAQKRKQNIIQMDDACRHGQLEK